VQKKSISDSASSEESVMHRAVATRLGQRLMNNTDITLMLIKSR
jgi:hypothetical protein